MTNHSALVVDTRTILAYYKGLPKASWIQEAIKNNRPRLYANSYSLGQIIYIIGKTKGMEIARREQARLIAAFRALKDPGIDFYASQIKVGLGFPMADCITLATAKFLNIPVVFDRTPELENAIKHGLKKALKLTILFLDEFSVESKAVEEPAVITTLPVKTTPQIQEPIKVKPSVKKPQVTAASPVSFKDATHKLRSFPLVFNFWSTPPEDQPMLHPRSLYIQLYYEETSKQLSSEFVFPAVRLEQVKKESQTMATELGVSFSAYDNPTFGAVRLSSIPLEKYNLVQRRMLWFALNEFVSEIKNKTRDLPAGWDIPSEGTILLMPYDDIERAKKSQFPSQITKKIDMQQLYTKYEKQKETQYARAIDNLISDVLTTLLRGEGIALMVPKTSPEVAEISLFLMNFSEISGISFSRW